MKYSEELKFLGGLYCAVKNNSEEYKLFENFEEKINISVDKGILSSTTAYGIRKILPQNQKENIENLIDNIMNDEPIVSHSYESISVDKFGEELKYLGKLYETIENENCNKSDENLMKHFAQKIDISVSKGIISKETANGMKQIINDREIDALIVSVMNEDNNTHSKKTNRDTSRPSTIQRPSSSISADPCGRSSCGRSPC